MKSYLFFMLFFLCTAIHIFAQNLKEGDIIFQTSKSSQSIAIQIATHSRYSHVGIIYKKDNQFFVYEVTGKVELTLLKEWINRGENQHFIVKRLKNST